MTAWSAHHPPMESNANPAVIVNGLNAAGVELISPENPNFDSAVMSLLPTRTATVALDLKPAIRSAALCELPSGKRHPHQAAHSECAS
jgi:hypothetical protein